MSMLHIPRAQATGLALPLALFYCVGFVLVGGGFVLYTTTDAALTRETGAGSLVSQLILGVFYLVGALLWVTCRDARRLFVLVWPILLLPALAMASALWSPDPLLTLRRAIAFAGTILFGLSLGSAYRFRDTLSLVVVSLTIVMGLSIALAVLDPVRAIHQPNDAIQAVHAGAWRGIFAHRNTLGFWSGASLVLIALAGREALGSRWLWLGAMAMAALCLVATGSSAGLAIVALAGAWFLVLASTLHQPPGRRGALVVFWLLVALLVYLLFETIAGFALQLLGRDSDLSGRTELWSYLIDLIRAADKPLGLGYFVGTLVLDQRLSSATQIRNVNAHNGFVEAYVYFGWLGVVLAIALVAWLLAASLRLAQASRAQVGLLGTVPSVMVFLAVAHNLVESTIVSPNNLNNLLLAVAAAMAARARLDRDDFTSRIRRAGPSSSLPGR